MGKINWCDILGWGDEQLQELRCIGYTYLREGRYEIAKTFFEAVTILAPQSALDKRMLGAIFLYMGDNQRALESLERSLQLDPENPGAQLNRAKALFYLGKLPEGREQADKLVACADERIANDAKALLMAYT